MSNDLKAMRARIDKLDEQLQMLITERARIAQQVAQTAVGNECRPRVERRGAPSLLHRGRGRECEREDNVRGAGFFRRGGI